MIHYPSEAVGPTLRTVTIFKRTPHNSVHCSQLTCLAITDGEIMALHRNIVTIILDNSRFQHRHATIQRAAKLKLLSQDAFATGLPAVSIKFENLHF